MSLLSISNIDRAHSILKSLTIKTPLITNESINTLVNAKVYFKLENLQQTGSFKIRGASYKVLLLTNNQKKNGVVAKTNGGEGKSFRVKGNL